MHTQTQWLRLRLPTVTLARMLRRLANVPSEWMTARQQSRHDKIVDELAWRKAQTAE